VTAQGAAKLIAVIHRTRAPGSACSAPAEGAARSDPRARVRAGGRRQGAAKLIAGPVDQTEEFRSYAPMIVADAVRVKK
jgi:hypothetical protein